MKNLIKSILLTAFSSFFLNAEKTLVPPAFTPLFEAIANGDLEQVKKLITSNPGLINKEDRGSLPLAYAIETEQEAIVKELLKNKNIDSQYIHNALDFVKREGNIDKNLENILIQEFVARSDAELKARKSGQK